MLSTNFQIYIYKLIYFKKNSKGAMASRGSRMALSLPRIELGNCPLYSIFEWLCLCLVQS
jgi:hypothetical protein